MTRKAPGRSDRSGMTMVQGVQLFSDEAAVERMFIECRWPNGVACPVCGSLNVQERPTRKPQPFRCRDCRKDFSVKTGTVMQSSNLPLHKWALAMFLMTTNLKGVSSMKLSRDLGITQRSAWHLAHRIRKSWGQDLFSGPVEVDETYVGGKEGNKHQSKRRPYGIGPMSKTPVAGVLDRETNQVSSAPVPDTRKQTLTEFIEDRVAPEAMVYSDDHGAYRHLPNHESVSHGAGEYVRGEVHTNSMESHWAMLKRGITGTYHQLSPKHLHRYSAEFDGRHNDRDSDTLDQVMHMMAGVVGKRLKYADLVSD